MKTYVLKKPSRSIVTEKELKFYNYKIIMNSKDNFEFYKYDRSQLYNQTPRVKKAPRLFISKMAEKKNRNEKIKFPSSIYRTKTTVRRLISANPDMDKFITFTFSGNEYYDLKKTNYLFNQFIKRLKYKFKNIDLKYIAVVEFQSDIDYNGNVKPNGGNVHYHCLMNLPYIKKQDLKSKLFEVWGHGSVTTRKIYDLKYLSFYLIKYFNKDYVHPKLFGKKKFFHSLNLLRPIIMRCYDIPDLFLRVLDSFNLFKSVWNNIYTGRVFYIQAISP